MGVESAWRVIGSRHGLFGRIVSDLETLYGQKLANWSPGESSPPEAILASARSIRQLPKACTSSILFSVDAEAGVPGAQRGSIRMSHPSNGESILRFDAARPRLPWKRKAAFASTAARLLRDLQVRSPRAPWPNLETPPIQGLLSLRDFAIYARHWELATLKDGKASLVSRRSGTNIADPFPYHHAGEDWLFFEEEESGKPGILSVGRLCKDGLTDIHHDILPSSTHRSWPNVFESRGEIWMLPESGEDREVALWKCVEFPHHWTKERTLLSGRAHLDPLLFEHEGLWWLFVSESGPTPSSHSDTLSLYWSEDPWSMPFTPHPWNPVAIGLVGSRMAGRILVDEHGGLIRPAQDGSSHYGRAVVLKRIDEISRERYCESELERIEAPASYRGIHTWNPFGESIVVDLLSESPRWPLVSRLLSHSKR